MRSVQIELPSRLLDYPSHDAPLAPIERVIGLHARVAPVASRRIVALDRLDRGKAGAVALAVGGQLPVQQLDQIVLIQRLEYRLLFHSRFLLWELLRPSVEGLELYDRAAVVRADPEGHRR